MKYQVERGLDVAIGEYALGRAIVVDKDTYQIIFLAGLMGPAEQFHLPLTVINKFCLLLDLGKAGQPILR